ncbi:MAG: hypothetical protein Q4B18_02750 [Bacillota bacterium]|nr:hypothetical protein [Bacillota bacterium]
MDFSKTAKTPALLKEENRHYAHDPSKKIHGYIKIERTGDSGLIDITVENVKFFSGGQYIYKLILAGTRNERRCYHLVGTVPVGADGHGSVEFRINASNLDGNGTFLKDFTTAIVAAMSSTNNHESLHPVLKGPLTAPPGTFNEFYNRVVLQKCISLAKAQDSFSDIVPFGSEALKRLGAGSLEIVWKKVTEAEAFPVVSPGSERPIRKYGHFLWGYSDKYYYLAVPGRFLPEDQPDEGKSGFVLWCPILGMERKADDSNVSEDQRRRNIYGYWLASINRYNGHIEEIPLIAD